ncbi:MAG: DUF4430 domain-containing protein [Oscillospiraceae bacterium]|nr:DUF4430 domain-containing protein [Oscillospiraceae bacterium]
MKKTRTALAALLCAVSVTLTACGEKTAPESSASVISTVVSGAGGNSSTGVESAGNSSESPESAISSESSAVSSGESSAPAGTDAGLWSSATYTEDAEIGSGAHTALITVTIDGKSVVITVKSDKDNLAEMLVETGLAEGDDSEYGLYIKRVNGVLADYSVDQSYWSLLQNGVPTAVGASSITITDGDAYELMYVSAMDAAA